MGKLAVGLAVLLATMATAATAMAAPGGDLRVRPNAFLFGQAPDWLDSNTVVYHDPTGRDEGDGQVQIWRSARVDQGCLMRSLRNEILGRLAGVDGVGEIPFGLSREIRNRAVELLADPTAFTRRVQGCGGETAPATPLVLEQRTRIGRLLPRHSG